MYDHYGNAHKNPSGDIFCCPYTNLFMPKLVAYIVIKLLPCIYCRWRQYMTKFATYIVSPLCKLLGNILGRNIICNLNWERERERERQKEIKFSLDGWKYIVQMNSHVWCFTFSFKNKHCFNVNMCFCAIHNSMT